MSKLISDMMFKEEIYQGSLFDDCSIKCEAYAACGGQRVTAPCGCAWTQSSGLRYQCHKCYLICRDRGLYNSEEKLQVKEFSTNIEDGFTLDQIDIIQSKYQFPICIPTHTNKYKGNVKFSRFVAVDARMLFNYPHNGIANLKSQFETESLLRQYLKVSKKCELIAVLNGEDKMLEKIWAMNRTAMFSKLVSIGFKICTAPTFSLTALTPSGSLVPFSHHTAMLMRHHRVLHEINKVGLCAVPNLYWLDGDARQLNNWVDWLKTHPEIYLISRDFTSTRHWSAIEPKIIELLNLFKEVGRLFHVLIIGTGHSNAPKIVEYLKREGHNVSVITSAPIMKAIHGSKYFITANGKLSDCACEKSEYSFDDLINYNLDLFEHKLSSIISPKVDKC